MLNKVMFFGRFAVCFGVVVLLNMKSSPDPMHQQGIFQGFAECFVPWLIIDSLWWQRYQKKKQKAEKAKDRDDEIQSGR